MAEIGVELDGLDELYKAIDRLDDLKDLLEPAVNEALMLLLGRMQEYPAGRGTYQRTGNLRRSWSMDAAGSGDVLGFVRSDPGIAPYNRYVQAAASQAWMHQGRWQTEEQVAEKEKAAVVSILARALEQYLRTV